MIAKLVIHAPNRKAAARKLVMACASVEVWPVPTNAAAPQQLATLEQKSRRVVEAASGLGFIGIGG